MQTFCPYCQVELRFVGNKADGPLKCPNCHRVWPSVQALAAPSTTVTSHVEAVKQVVACPKCTAHHTVPPTAGDHDLSCSQCRHRFQVPPPRAIHRPTRTSEGVLVRCRSCSREFSVPQAAVNEWVMCPGCSVVAIAVAA
jgi:Zn-finger nucleic acid-binding protein